jgi:release factor glutamine methyltransferase
MPSVLSAHRPGALRLLIGRGLGLAYTLTGKDDYDSFRVERVLDLRILVMPTVANPKLLRTGAFFAAELDARVIACDSAVLDMGTGSGVCALAAARRTSKRVVAVDINPAAARCARANALLNRLEERLDVRQGDLFVPVAGERFDVILFNPPFYVGTPRDDRDAAWRSSDAVERFAAGLADHLSPGGAAYVLLSTFGDGCALLETQLRARGFALEAFAQRRFINETLIILRATARGDGPGARAESAPETPA